MPKNDGKCFEDVPVHSGNSCGGICLLGVKKINLIEIIRNNVEKYRDFRYIYDAINHHENEPYFTALRRNFLFRTHF
jgi:hypothetical protein